MEAGPSEVAPHHSHQPQPVVDQAEGASSRLPAESGFPNALKVGNQSRVAAIAGRIAHDVRRGTLPVLLAAGETSIAVAVKAIARSRDYLRGDGLDVGFTPQFRDADHRRALLALHMLIIAAADGTQAADYAALGSTEIKVSAVSRHAKVGGAITGRLRDKGFATMSALGTKAIANSVLACAHAAVFVESEAQELRVQPFFMGEGPQGEGVVAFKLIVKFKVPDAIEPAT